MILIFAWGVLSVILAWQFYLFANKIAAMKPDKAAMPMANSKFGYPIFYGLAVLFALQAIPKFIYVLAAESNPVPDWATGSNIAGHIALVYIMLRAQKRVIVNV